jgi:predicted small secreted protein
LAATIRPDSTAAGKCAGNQDSGISMNSRTQKPVTPGNRGNTSRYRINGLAGDAKGKSLQSHLEQVASLNGRVRPIARVPVPKRETDDLSCCAALATQRRGWFSLAISMAGRPVWRHSFQHRTHAKDFIMRKNISLALTLLALLGLAPLLGACHTTAGAGQDLSAGGHAITNSAEKHAP